MTAPLCTVVWVDLALRVTAGVVGTLAIFSFFKSVIRVGILNQRYQDPLAFWAGRIVLLAFKFRARGAGREEKGRMLTWYWPCALISIITTWFVLVTAGFALLTWAVGAEATLLDALIASGSALSTLGFSTPAHTAGQLLAIFEGAIGLFLIVYLFTFLPGFMDLIHRRGERVSWVYARAGAVPSGALLLLWFQREGRSGDLDGVWEEWESFFRDLSQARSFLPILSFIRPLDPAMSWVCAFGAVLDALAVASSCVSGPRDSARIALDCGVVAVKNIYCSLRGSPIRPEKSPALLHVARERFDSGCGALRGAGFALEPDLGKAWDAFLSAHMRYEEEIAWLAALLDDPTPEWPVPIHHSTSNAKLR